jgi:O-antigen/teichoic acid export membrane protein
VTPDWLEQSLPTSDFFRMRSQGTGRLKGINISLQAGFFKNAIAYSGTNIISQVVLFFQGFILRRIIPPEVMGVWNFVGVARNFVASFSLGILAGALRELPIWKGKGDEKAQINCRSVSLTYSLVEIVFVAIFVVVYAFLKKGSISYAEFIGLLLAAILLFFTRFQESYITFFQGAQLYFPLSRLLFTNSLIMALSLLIGAIAIGLWGVFLGALIAEGLKAVWMTFAAKHFGISPKLKWDFQIFKRLASYSIFLKITDYPITLFMMLDLLWVTKFMDIKSLAIYAMARSFFLQSSEITVRFGTVFMTRTFEQYGKGEEKEKIAADMYRFIQIQLLVAIPLICWAIFFAAPFLIRQVIPLYSEGIYPMTILLIASFFDLRNNNLFTIWIAEKKLGSYGKANLFSLISMLISISVCWFIVGNKTLNGIAVAVVIGYLINFMYIMGTIGRELLGNERILKLFIQVSLTIMWVAGILIYFAHKEVLHISFYEDIIYSFKKAIIVLILILPFIFTGLKTSGAGNLLYRKWQALKTKP